MPDLNKLKDLYERSPGFVKKTFGLIPFSWRCGKDYRDWTESLLEDSVVDSFLKLKETVLFAWENIPYYKEKWKAIDFHPNEFKSIEHFQQLPFIDKDEVKNNYDTLQNPKLDSSDSFYVTTGGSSGSQMKFLQSKNVWWKELAFVMNTFSAYGYSPGNRKASFRGGDFNNL